jgi:hypothetical protein
MFPRLVFPSPECHQACLDITRITHKELLRRAFMDWTTWPECQTLLQQLKVKEGVNFEEMCNELDQNFRQWKVHIRSDNKSVGVFCLNFMKAMEVLELYDFGIKKEKPMLNEMLMVELLPFWSLFGKSRYHIKLYLYSDVLDPDFFLDQYKKFKCLNCKVLIFFFLTF